MQTFQNEQTKKIGNWIIARLSTFENVFVILLMILIILKSTTHVQLGVFITLLMLGLSTMYFFLGFADLDDENVGGLEYFIHKLASWSLSINLVGILYLIQHWKFSDLFLRVGTLTLIICIASIFWLNSKKPDMKVFNARYLVRIILVCSIGVFLIFGGHKYF